MKRLIAQLAMLLVALMPLTFISCDKSEDEISEEELISEFVGNWYFNWPIEYYVIKSDYTCAYYEPHSTNTYDNFIYTKEDGTWILNNKECIMTFPSGAAKARYIYESIKINDHIARSCGTSELPTVTEFSSGRDELCRNDEKRPAGR